MNGRQRVGHPTRTAVSGPLAPYADGFREDLAAKGYHSQVVGRHVGLMADLSRWLEGRHCSSDALAGEVVREFVQARRAAGSRDLISTAVWDRCWDICAARVPRPRPKRRSRLRRWIGCWPRSPTTWCGSVVFRPRR